MKPQYSHQTRPSLGARPCSIIILALLSLPARYLAQSSACVSTPPGLSVTVLGTTATQALISYTSPDSNPCTIQVSTSPTLSPLLTDVDPGTFAGSNSDLSRPSTQINGNARLVTIGERGGTDMLATAGAFAGIRHFSRTAQNTTTYFGNVACTGVSANFSFATTNIPLGQTYADPWLQDPAHPGDQPYPETIDGITPETRTDEFTGTLLERVSLRSNNYQCFSSAGGRCGSAPVIATAYDQGHTPCDSAGPWVNPCGTITVGGSGSTTITNNAAVLVIRPPMIVPANDIPAISWGQYTQTWTLDQIQLQLTGLASIGSILLNGCYSLNAGASCATAAFPLTFTSSSTTQNLGQYSLSTYGVDPYLMASTPRISMQKIVPDKGAATASGSTLTWTSSATGNTWNSLDWTTGGNGRIRISTVSQADACLATGSTGAAEYTITGVVNGLSITVTPTPPSGPVSWCENNFAVMLWTPTPSAATLTLTGAKFAEVQGQDDFIPDNGASNGCLSTQISGWWFCDFGGVFAMQPSGSIAYFGGRTVPCTLSTCTPSIANGFSSAGLIDQAGTANIDQTITTSLCNYATAGGGSGAGPVLVQACFLPSSISIPATPYFDGNGFNNISYSVPASNTAYSVTYVDGNTYTNLTPQNSGGTCETLTCQLATFDTRFNPSMSWTWTAYGTSQGVVFLDASSAGLDSFAWNIAFYVGDGNPAHAGCPPSAPSSAQCPGGTGLLGGPRVIGSMPTWDTPNCTMFPTNCNNLTGTAVLGKSLHAFAETGESGYIQINTHDAPLKNTTNTTIPSGSTTTCASLGIVGNTNICIQLLINSFTEGSPCVSGCTGYDPYLGGIQFGIGTVTLASSGAGGYHAADQLTVTQGGSNNQGTIIVGTVDGSGNILTYSVSTTAMGKAYTLASGVSTSGGHGSGATFNITALSATTSNSGTIDTYFTGYPGEMRVAEVGDTACVSSGSSCSLTGGNELMTLLVKGGSGIWTFQRQIKGTSQVSLSGATTLHWGSLTNIPITNYANGAVSMYWNPLTGCSGSLDPHGNCLIQSINNNSGHGEWRDGGSAESINVPAWNTTSAFQGGADFGWDSYPTDYQTFTGTVPGIFTLYGNANDTPGTITTPGTGVNYTSYSPPFGWSTTPTISSCAGCYWAAPWSNQGGTHPNPAGQNAGSNESIRAFDAATFGGGTASLDHMDLALVSGQLWLYRPTQVIDADDIGNCGVSQPCVLPQVNRKVMAQAVSCGNHPVVDVSGPGATIATDNTTPYQYCWSRNVNDCVSGSLVGDVYINCPGVSVLETSGPNTGDAYCAGAATHPGVPFGQINDICFGNQGVAGNTLRQFTLDRTDLIGAYTRTLVSSTARVRMTYGLENNRTLPDNSWEFYRAEWLNNQRAGMWAAKIPPYPATDSFNRGTWIPVTLAITPPGGTNNAIVSFGYQEHGTPSQFRCTTFKDSCIATAATVTAGNSPFFYASESPSGAACSSSCTITIPAISQRILYYQVSYRNSSNVVLSTSQVFAYVVP